MMVKCEYKFPWETMSVKCCWMLEKFGLGSDKSEMVELRATPLSKFRRYKRQEFTSRVAWKKRIMSNQINSFNSWFWIRRSNIMLQLNEISIIKCTCFLTLFLVQTSRTVFRWIIVQDDVTITGEKRQIFTNTRIHCHWAMSVLERSTPTVTLVISL